MNKKKRNALSVTTELCKCEFLERCAKDPEKPINFNPKVNEFHFEYKTDRGSVSHLIIYHCPFCGGAAPESIRESLFEVVPLTEMKRLQKLTATIHSIEDALSKLGLPDEDSQSNVAGITPERDRKPQKIQNFRRIVYRNLSDVAEIHITDFLRDRVSIFFQGKPIGSKK